MIDLTQDSALETIFDKRNQRRKIWTPTILIDRMGIARSPVTYGNYDKRALNRAKKILHELWLDRQLIRKVELDTRNRYLAGSEIAYIRPADAPAKFLIPCLHCRAPCLSHGRLDLQCDKCVQS
jgi:hypothetical protein